MNRKESKGFLKKKNNLSIEEIQQRMKLQLSDTEKSQYADYLISNSGNIEQLRVQTLNVFQDILSH
jgi:dephospho-CoA kinase